MRWWALVFAALTAALGIALLLEVRENRRLRSALVALATEKAHAAGLLPGRVLEPVTLHDPAGNDVRVDFAGDAAGTLLLFHASGCDACTLSAFFWRNALEQAARPDVRVLVLQTDVAHGAPTDLPGLPASLAVPLPPLGWLAALPAVPATLVVDAQGAVVQAWYGELDVLRAEELAEAILALPEVGER